MTDMGRAIDMIGRQVGHWKVLYRAERHEKNGRVMWWCRCRCGSCQTIAGTQLRAGVTRQCVNCQADAATTPHNPPTPRKLKQLATLGLFTYCS